MTFTLREALDRTLLLMRDDVDASDEALLKALTSTKVALVADKAALRTHSGQTAYVTAALLMARSGHQVSLVAPDIEMVGIQPPLQPGGIITALVAVGHDLLPDIAFQLEPPPLADLEIRLGLTPHSVPCKQSLALGAADWLGSLHTQHPALWTASSWPFGALATGGLGATEAFKVAMRKLRSYARNPAMFDAQFARCTNVSFALAPPTAARTNILGIFDCVSAGAIAQSALYALARIPDVTGNARTMDDDTGAVSNLNRNAFACRSTLGISKVGMLAMQDLGGLRIHPCPERFVQSAAGDTQLADRVLVGVDHIPTRWDVQKTNPAWLGVGATSHWSAMSSFHVDGLPCAGCLHPTDSPDAGRIPTVAFVSFWGGLMLAADFVRAAAGESLPAGAQQKYLTAPRPEALWQGPIARHAECPVGHAG